MTMVRGELEKDSLYSNQVRNDKELNEGSNVQREKQTNLKDLKEQEIIRFDD